MLNQWVDSCCSAISPSQGDLCVYLWAFLGELRAGGDEKLRGWDEGGWRERILKEVTGKGAF